MADGLLGFLGDVGKGLLQGISQAGATYAASQGRPQLLEAMQAQQQRQNLLNQLQSMSQQEMEGPFGQTLQRQLQFGDLAGAQKTLINLPQYKQFEASLDDPSLGLSEGQKQAAKTLGALNPESAQEYLKTALRLSGEEQKQTRVMEKTFAQRQALEEKKMQRLEAKTPAAVIAEAVRKKVLTPENAKEVLPGILRGKEIKIPTDPNERQVFLQDLLADPTLRLLPAKKQQGIFSSIRSFFFGEPQVASEQAAPMQTEEQKRQRLQELLIKQQGQ